MTRSLQLVAAFLFVITVAGCDFPLSGKSHQGASEKTARPPSRGPNTTPSPSGLVPLPCGATGPLRPVSVRYYCGRNRHFVTPKAYRVLLAAANDFSRAYPGSIILYMDASWPSGVVPMRPHRSHGDGREIDLALFYETSSDRPLSAPPPSPLPEEPGFGAYEPPRDPKDRVCAGHRGPRNSFERLDPPQSRSW